MKKVKRYTTKFKLDALERAKTESPTKVAEDLGVTASMLWYWKMRDKGVAKAKGEERPTTKAKTNGVGQGDRVRDAIIYLRHARDTMEVKKGRHDRHQLMVLLALSTLEGR